jgi:AcrR family transcriptional regulator
MTSICVLPNSTLREKRRAELEAETRRRITESAVELHGTVGPARTSISAVAERAGVRRSTVYRHFPDDEALFGACSSHWAAANPLTEQMMENLLRDEQTVATVKRLFQCLPPVRGGGSRDPPARPSGTGSPPRRHTRRDRPRARLRDVAVADP